MENLIFYAASACLVLGALFCLVGALGVLRMPDALTQLHAASATDTLGAALIIIGLILKVGAGLLSFKLFIILFFLFFTSPAASHSLARAVRHYRHRPWKQRVDTEQSASQGDQA